MTDFSKYMTATPAKKDLSSYIGGTGQATSAVAESPQQPMDIPPISPLGVAANFLDPRKMGARLGGVAEAISGSLTRAKERANRGLTSLAGITNPSAGTFGPQAAMGLIGAAGEIAALPSMAVTGLFKPEIEQTFKLAAQSIPEPVRVAATKIINDIPDEYKDMYGDAFAGLGLLTIPSEIKAVKTVIGEAKKIPGEITKISNKLADMNKERIFNNRVKELTQLQQNNAPLRKMILQAKTKGNDVVNELAKTDLLNGAVDNTGTVRTQPAIANLNEFMKPQEDIISRTLVNEGKTIPLKNVEIKLTDAVNKSGLKGGAKIRALNNVKQDMEGYALDAVESGGTQSLPISVIHDAKVDKYANINYLNPETKRADKIIASTLKKIVEENSSANVKALNAELSKWYSMQNFLEKLDGRKVANGRLGKLFAQTIGSVVGAPLGPLGSIAGAELGGFIKGASMASKLSGVTGAELKQSGLMQNALKNANTPKELPMLPVGKTNLPKSQVNVPIPLGAQVLDEPVARISGSSGSAPVASIAKQTEGLIKPEEINFLYDKPKSPTVMNAEGQVIEEMFNSVKGERVFSADGVTGLKSTFPDWVSPELRLKKLFDNTINQLIEGKMPKGRAKQLYQEMINEAKKRVVKLGGEVSGAQKDINFVAPTPFDKDVAGVNALKTPENGAIMKGTQTKMNTPKSPEKPTVAVTTGNPAGKLDANKMEEILQKSSWDSKIKLTPEETKIRDDFFDYTTKPEVIAKYEAGAKDVEIIDDYISSIENKKAGVSPVTPIKAESSAVVGKEYTNNSTMFDMKGNEKQFTDKIKVTEIKDGMVHYKLVDDVGSGAMTEEAFKRDVLGQVAPKAKPSTKSIVAANDGAATSGPKSTVELLPKEDSLYQEAKKVGAKRIAPDRVVHQQLTPEESINKLIQKSKDSATRNATAWQKMNEDAKYLKDKYKTDILPPRTEANLKKYPDLLEDQRKFIHLKENSTSKTLTGIEKWTQDVSDHWSKKAAADYSAKAKSDYIDLVKSDISKGYKYPDEVLNYDKAFKTAVDNRERYEKGLRTSFSSDDSRIVFDEAEKIGTGMKRQDGKIITDAQKAEIKNGVIDFADTFGLDMKKLAQDDRWVYVHLNGKNPFLQKNTAGLYRKGADNVSISVGGTESFEKIVDGKKVVEKVNPTMAHELGHALDHKTANGVFEKPLLWQRAKDFNPVDYSLSSKGREYWTSNSEITARMIEEYVASKKGLTAIFERQGYWPKSIFEKDIAPAVEAAIEKHFADYKKAV